MYDVMVNVSNLRHCRTAIGVELEKIVRMTEKSEFELDDKRHARRI